MNVGKRSLSRRTFEVNANICRFSMEIAKLVKAKKEQANVPLQTHEHSQERIRDQLALEKTNLEQQIQDLQLKLAEARTREQTLQTQFHALQRTAVVDLQESQEATAQLQWQVTLLSAERDGNAQKLKEKRTQYESLDQEFKALESSTGQLRAEAASLQLDNEALTRQLHSLEEEHRISVKVAQDLAQQVAKSQLNTRDPKQLSRLQAENERLQLEAAELESRVTAMVANATGQVFDEEEKRHRVEGLLAQRAQELRHAQETVTTLKHVNDILKARLAGAQSSQPSKQVTEIPILKEKTVNKINYVLIEKAHYEKLVSRYKSSCIALDRRLNDGEKKAARVLAQPLRSKLTNLKTQAADSKEGKHNIWIVAADLEELKQASDDAYNQYMEQRAKGAAQSAESAQPAPVLSAAAASPSVVDDASLQENDRLKQRIRELEDQLIQRAAVVETTMAPPPPPPPPFPMGAPPPPPPPLPGNALAPLFSRGAAPPPPPLPQPGAAKDAARTNMLAAITSFKKEKLSKAGGAEPLATAASKSGGLDLGELKAKVKDSHASSGGAVPSKELVFTRQMFDETKQLTMDLKTGTDAKKADRLSELTAKLNTDIEKARSYGDQRLLKNLQKQQREIADLASVQGGTLAIERRVFKPEMLSEMKRLLIVIKLNPANCEAEKARLVEFKAFLTTDLSAATLSQDILLKKSLDKQHAEIMGFENRPYTEDELKDLQEQLKQERQRSIAAQVQKPVSLDIAGALSKKFAATKKIEASADDWSDDEEDSMSAKKLGSSAVVLHATGKIAASTRPLTPVSQPVVSAPVAPPSVNPDFFPAAPAIPAGAAKKLPPPVPPKPQGK